MFPTWYSPKRPRPFHQPTPTRIAAVPAVSSLYGNKTSTDELLTKQAHRLASQWIEGWCVSVCGCVAYVSRLLLLRRLMSPPIQSKNSTRKKALNQPSPPGAFLTPVGLVETVAPGWSLVSLSSWCVVFLFLTWLVELVSASVLVLIPVAGT